MAGLYWSYDRRSDEKSETNGGVEVPVEGRAGGPGPGPAGAERVSDDEGQYSTTSLTSQTLQTDNVISLEHLHTLQIRIQ
jgi:hypothetical protein